MPESEATVRSALEDSDPLVRMGALRALEGQPVALQIRWATPLLSDPVRAVRLEATRLLAAVDPQAMSDEQRASFLGSVEEYRQSQLAVAERAEAHLNLGWMAASLGDFATAESHYQEAIERDPLFIPAYVNLADLYRARGRDAAGEAQLRRAIEIAPEAAEAHHSLGLLLIRRGRHDEALVTLARAV